MGVRGTYNTAKREEIVKMSVTTEEKIQIDEMAKTVGMCRNDYLRSLVFAPGEKIKVVKKTEKGVPELKQAVLELAKIGGNLNQISKRNNQGLSSLWIDQITLDELLTTIQREIFSLKDIIRKEWK